MRRQRPTSISRKLGKRSPYELLRANELDVLVNWLASDEPDLITGPAIEYRDRVVAVATLHPLAQYRSVLLDDIAKYDVTPYPADFPKALSDALCPPTTTSSVPLHRAGAAHAIGEVLSLIALGRIVHPTVTSVPQFQRDDIVLVPIQDLDPLPLGLIWCKAHENERIRNLARIAEELSAEARDGAFGRDTAANGDSGIRRARSCQDACSDGDDI